MDFIIQLIVLILILFLDLYIAQRNNKKYNITQNSILKYKELNREHKKNMRLTTTIAMPIFLIVTNNVYDLGANKIIEFIAYCLAAYFLILALLDLYYPKDKKVFKLSLKRIFYVYSLCFTSYIFLFLIQ